MQEALLTLRQMPRGPLPTTASTIASGYSCGVSQPVGEFRSACQLPGQIGFGKQTDSFDIVVELGASQCVHDRRNLSERIVLSFFRIINADFKLDFLVKRRSIDQQVGGLKISGKFP